MKGKNLVVWCQNVTREEVLTLVVVFCEKQLCKIHCSARPESSVELFYMEETVLWIHCHTHRKGIYTPLFVYCYFNPSSYVHPDTLFLLLLTAMRQQLKDIRYTAVVELFKERHKLFNIKGMPKSKREFAWGFQYSPSVSMYKVPTTLVRNVHLYRVHVRYSQLKSAWR